MLKSGQIKLSVLNKKNPKQQQKTTTNIASLVQLLKTVRMEQPIQTNNKSYVRWKFHQILHDLYGILEMINKIISIYVMDIKFHNIGDYKTTQYTVNKTINKKCKQNQCNIHNY